MAEVVVVGAGVAGLATALTLSRQGVDIHVIERDDTPLPPSASEAFWWNRSGAPQVRHSHGFLARLRTLLLEHYPDLLTSLLEAGASEMQFVAVMPAGMDRTPQPGDEDLVGLSCRHSTFEWVLRRTVLSSPNVTLETGCAVATLAVNGAEVTGVELDDGSVLEAELVVLANGRRCDVNRLLGNERITETVQDTGIVYLSRFYELVDAADYPPLVGSTAGDLGYLKYGLFHGDNRTFSVTLATATTDHELRSLLRTPEYFDAAAAQITTLHPYFDGRATSTTEVEVMGSLINRRREFLNPDGQPVVRGMVAVGDAHTCTNPLYGRGCTLAVVQAHLLAEAMSAHGVREEAVIAYERACREEVRAWYEAAVAQDRLNSASSDSADSPGSSNVQMREFIAEGVLPAVASDPMVFRAFLRMFNMLESPNSLMSNGEVFGRIMATYQDRANRTPAPPVGPPRQELLDRLSGV